jgi:hypothetical protein
VRERSINGVSIVPVGGKENERFFFFGGGNVIVNSMFNNFVEKRTRNHCVSEI